MTTNNVSPNLKLNLPTYAEAADVQDLTSNFGTIDTHIGNLNEAVFGDKGDQESSGGTIADTYATKEYVDEAIAGADVDLSGYMPKAGGDFTGAVTVQEPGADMNPATKKYVDDTIDDMFAQLADYEF